jgi:hypothetical protein
MKASREKAPSPPPARPRTRYNIQVTAKDIAKAKRNDSYVCVVARLDSASYQARAGVAAAQ